MEALLLHHLPVAAVVSLVVLCLQPHGMVVVELPLHLLSRQAATEATAAAAAFPQRQRQQLH